MILTNLNLEEIGIHLKVKKLEIEARKAYERLLGCKVDEFGLLVLPRSSWLGVSIDGMSLVNNRKTIIEIKCPKNDDN